MPVHPDELGHLHLGKVSGFSQGMKHLPIDQVARTCLSKDTRSVGGPHSDRAVISAWNPGSAG